MMPNNNPYPGLRPFQEADAHLFFGRKSQVNELLEGLKTDRVLAVVGLSGSGKSSLIRAGLLPALHLGAMGEEFADWRVAVLEPGMDPVGALSAALDDPNVLGPDPEGRAILERSGRGLAERALRASLPDGSYLLVFVDQFEEIFRFRKERAEGPEEAVRFVRLLLEAAAEEWSRVHVLLTMRSDFLGECAQFRGLPEVLNRCQYLVRGMTRDERREAIERPSRQPRLTLEPQLVERLLNDIGDDPDRLPVLQHALMRTYEVGKPGPLTVEHYKQTGTMANALDRHAQTVYDELSGPDQLVAKRMFQRLSERRAGARDTRRPAPIADIAAVAGVPTERVMGIYEHFSKEGRTFLTSRSRRLSEGLAPRRADIEKLTPESLIDVTHESLLHGWKKLKDWINDEEEWSRRFLMFAEGIS
jgi:hypothetical protein